MARKETTNPSTALIPAERIERSILLIRGEKVLLDRDLADLYQVETRVLIQAVKRNIGRFPTDFMFQLSTKELERWRSQFVMSNHAAKMGLRRRPYAFTEQGVAMLSSVLHSERAVDVNIEIMRAFVRLRQMLASHEELARKLDALEKKYDAQFRVVFDAIRQLMARRRPSRRNGGSDSAHRVSLTIADEHAVTVSGRVSRIAGGHTLSSGPMKHKSRS